VGTRVVDAQKRVLPAVTGTSALHVIPVRIRAWLLATGQFDHVIGPGCWPTELVNAT
jgi:hypothetical protein